MTTDKRLAANRRNALKSTGPKTEYGKVVARKNATKFGLFSRDVVLPDESAQEYETVARRVIGDLQPAGAIEQALAETIAAMLWRLRRVYTIEAGVIQMYRVYDGVDGGIACAFAHDARELDCIGRLSRYETSLERRLSRTLDQLRRAQSTRRLGTQFIDINGA